MTTETPSASDIALSDPKALLTGKPLPSRDYVFRTPDGARVKVRLQGLTYAQKSELDAIARAERDESEKNGVVKPDLRAPMLIARAFRNPDGSRAFTRYEDEMVYAIGLSEQNGDGEINRASNVVLELSGYGPEALADAEKA